MESEVEDDVDLSDIEKATDMPTRVTPTSATSSSHSDEKDHPSQDNIENSPLYKRMTIIMHVLIFLYSSSFWIQTNTFPFLSKKLGASPVMFGYLETVFSIGLLVGGPLFGRFGDLFGARAAMTMAMASSATTYFILSVTNSIPMLFLSRLPSVFMHAFHAAQMVMTDVTGASDRADALGKLGVSYGLGIVIGPLFGGYLTTNYSEQFACVVGGVICLVAIAIVWIFVPKSTKHKKPPKSKKDGGVFDVKAIFSLLKIPAVAIIIVLKTVTGIPVGVWHSMFTLVNVEKFGIDAQTNGYIMSYVGVVTIIIQGFGIKILTKRYNDGILLKVSLVVKTFCYLALAFTDTLPLYLALIVPMVATGAILNVITNSAITKLVSESDTGTVLGLNMASNSVIRTFSPTMGGYLYSWIGFPVFGMLGFIMTGFTSVSLLTVFSNIKLS